MQVCTSPINTISYSPDNGSVLAMGSHNGTVHTFSASVNNTYKEPIGKFMSDQDIFPE